MEETRNEVTTMETGMVESNETTEDSGGLTTFGKVIVGLGVAAVIGTIVFLQRRKKNEEAEESEEIIEEAEEVEVVENDPEPEEESKK